MQLGQKIIISLFRNGSSNAGSVHQNRAYLIPASIHENNYGE